MRNAERFLAQGKIRAAISEYKRVVENDPKDFGTLNILGDLYIKNSEQQEAVSCFTEVAEHYNTQGFSQKAIAVYNKISRLKPDSMEVSAKLAHLYKSKGSFAEARTHYTTLAEEYQRKGQKIEALAIWKQIAELDSHDTGIYLKIADIYWQENQKDEAAKAFSEAGLRLSAQKQYEPALTAFSKALEVNRYDLPTLKGYVNAQIKLDYAEEAAKILEDILVEQPYNREVLFLLIDCYIETDNPQEAERAIIKLVEHEPSNYPKFLELVEVYLKKNDLDSASRLLSMSSEHLLVGGQSEEFLHWTNEILARNPEHLDALRLSVRYYGWHRDESELRKSLETLAEIARHNESVDDERYALSQLVMIAPHETAYAQRLQEIKAEYGLPETDLEPVLVAGNLTEDAPKFESFDLNDQTNGNGQAFDGNFGEFSTDFDFSGADFGVETNHNGSHKSENGFAFAGDGFDEYIVDGAVEKTRSDEEIDDDESENAELKPADAVRLVQEVESVEFYIAQGYKELAEKTLNTLEEEFGNRHELAELRLQLDDSLQTLAAKSKPKKKKKSKRPEISEEVVAEDATEAAIEDTAEDTAEDTTQAVTDAKRFDILSEFKTDLGFEETEPAATGDYETHYHMAIAYKEMGLMEDSIREFQDAINLVKPNDRTRCFFQCATLLGHCFMEKAMPNLALMWYRRAFEVNDLNDEEKQALFYEIANAYETGGDNEKAIEYFEKIYAENVDYRDIGRRLEKLR
ncbi:MAG TPA: tetratricopeptide repeat protein [Pyrinomonadaceae bacterium]|jgi:tetratricopeptide (TPR) repeat protein